MTFPPLRAATRLAGSASTSTFRPTASAAAGLRPSPSLDRLVTFQRVTPKGLIAESIKTKYLRPFLRHPFRVVPIHSIDPVGDTAFS